MTLSRDQSTATAWSSTTVPPRIAMHGATALSARPCPDTSAAAAGRAIGVSRHRVSKVVTAVACAHRSVADCGIRAERRECDGYRDAGRLCGASDNDDGVITGRAKSTCPSAVREQYVERRDIDVSRCRRDNREISLRNHNCADDRLPAVASTLCILWCRCRPSAVHTDSASPVLRSYHVLPSTSARVLLCRPYCTPTPDAVYNGHGIETAMCYRRCGCAERFCTAWI